MLYPLYFTLGILPSVIWLLFFLREDAHPEPNRVIIKVFCYGILSAFLAAIFEFSLSDISTRLNLMVFLSPLAFSILNTFIGVSLIEEYFKYIVVKKKAISAPEFDEPTDAMLYMIIAGLGFAALENILVLLPSAINPYVSISDTLSLILFRFLGATFLHALASGIIGFFIALSFFNKKHKIKLLVIGLFTATFLHGMYNFSIMELATEFKIIVPTIILGGLGIIVLLAFGKLRAIASVCKIK